MNGATRTLAILLTIVWGLSSSAQSVARVLIDEGWRNYQDQHLAAAQELLEQAVREAVAVKQEPDLGESRAKLAWLKFETNQPAAAMVLAGEALKSSSTTIDAARAELILARTARSAERALSHFERARKILEPENGDPALISDDKPLAITYVAVAECHFALGNYQQAAEASRRAATIMDREADPALRARSLSITARAALALDRPERPLAEIESLLRGEKNRQLPFLVRMDCWCALAENKHRQGDLDGSYALLKGARDEFARQGPIDSALCAQIVLQQAQVRTDQGRLDDALLFAKWLAGLSKHVKEGHVNERRVNERLVAEGYAACGRIHFAAGRFSAARTDFQIAYDRHSTISGKSHPLTLAARLGLAKANLVSGNQDQAANELRAIIALSPGSRQSGEPWTWLAQDNLMSGRFIAAIAIAGRAQVLLEQSGVGKSPEMLEVLWLLSAANLSAGRFDEASTALNRLVELRREMPSSSDIWAAKSLQLQGLIALARGEDETAKVQFDRALEVWQRTQGPNQKPVPRPEFWHPDKAAVLLGLSIVHADGGASAAEAHWQSAYVAMSQELRDEVIALRVAALAGFCRRNKRDFDALWLYEKARGLLRQSVGPQHRLTLQVEQQLAALLTERGPHVGRASGNREQPAPYGAGQQGRPGGGVAETPSIRAVRSQPNLCPSSNRHGR